MESGAVEGERTVPRASPRPKIRLSPVGFWSYSRRDDELSRGRLSQLRSLLLAEIQTQYGRDGIQLFQDVSAIPHGADWERITTGAIDESTFFIPIVTPFYMQSRWCARETKMFQTREEAIFEAHPDLSRDRRRIFPLLWIDVCDVEALDEEAAAALKVAQWCDFSHLRHRNLDHDEEVLAKVAAFAKSIVDVLQFRVEAPLSEEERERLAREAGEAVRRGEEDRRRREEEETHEAERQRGLEEVAARAEAERLAAEEKGRQREREEAQRLAVGQRERNEAARRARAERLVALLRSRRLRWIAGAALVALLAILILSRLSGDGEPRPGIEAAPAAAPSPAASADQAATTAPDPTSTPAAPVLPSEAEWLLGRWCVGGNRANVQTISREGRNLVIDFAGRRQTERIAPPLAIGSMTTEIARYRPDGNALVIEEMGQPQQRLERCE